MISQSASLRVAPPSKDLSAAAARKAPPSSGHQRGERCIRSSALPRRRESKLRFYLDVIAGKWRHAVVESTHAGGARRQGIRRDVSRRAGHAFVSTYWMLRLPDGLAVAFSASHLAHSLQRRANLSSSSAAVSERTRLRSCLLSSERRLKPLSCCDWNVVAPSGARGPDEHFNRVPACLDTPAPRPCVHRRRRCGRP